MNIYFSRKSVHGGFQGGMYVGVYAENLQIEMKAKCIPVANSDF
jgi:hypothetical protein